MFALLGRQAHAQIIPAISSATLSVWGCGPLHIARVVVPVVSFIKAAIDHNRPLLPNGRAVARTRFWFRWAVPRALSVWFALAPWSGGSVGQLFLSHVTGLWAS